MKKVLSVLLTVCLLLGCLPLTAGAAAPLYGTVEGYDALGGSDCHYEVTGSGTAHTTVTVTGTVEWENELFGGNTIAVTVTPPSDLESTANTVTFSPGLTLEWDSEDNSKIEGTNTAILYFIPDPGLIDTVTIDWGDGRTQVIDVDATGAVLAEGPAAVEFEDVPAGEYYTDAVAWAVANGVTTGTSATKFSPNNTCTRAQAVTFLWRVFGEPEPASTNNPFTDVSPNEYYYKAVLWAVENGITNGATETTFNPKGKCIRAQIATFLYRAEGSPAVTGGSFTDVAAGSYYENAVKWAVANEITNGTSATKFSPQNNCTRGQIVTFLYRYCN